MSLNPGARFGPYEIQSVLGAGGMGEVYRARDIRLKREVALKTLPESFASDPDRLARFQREAEVLASLNHPNIAAIYGLEESNGARALVMELVEGETLAERIARGLIPVDEALPIAKQIAEALEAAHEQGIIHRDLKPANVKVRSDGTVKVLDFGLAKALEPVSARGADATVSPTITSPAMITGVGVLLGTAAYMSPEQARGRPADKRSDTWAFGCVTYEMLSGKRAFNGEDVSETLAFVMAREPDWTALPNDVPLAVRVLLRTCLEKDRRTRTVDAGAALFVLDHAATLVEQRQLPPPLSKAVARRSAWRRIAVPVAAVGIAAFTAGAGVWWVMRPASSAVVRTVVPASGGTALALQGADRDIAITPDGSRLVYRGTDQLFVRALDQLEPMAITGLGAPRHPFISPDGQWIGFFDGGALKKVAITGGPPVTISSVAGVVTRGATWGQDGTIVFAVGAAARGLLRVSADGGEPIVLTRPDLPHGELNHVWPEFLPNGKDVLFTILPSRAGLESAQIAVLNLQTGVSKVLIRGGSHAHYVSTGDLVYGVSGTLRAVPFDIQRLEVVGTAVPVLEGVVTTQQGAADIALANNGSLFYVAGVSGVTARQGIISVDRQGRTSPLSGIPPDIYRDIRVSPEGRRLALATQADVWTYDVTRATLSRLTTDPAPDSRPVWTPDGRRIIFTSARAGYPEIFSRQADGTGTDERLLTRSKDLIDLRADGWSPDGKQLLLTEVSAASPSAQCAIEQLPDHGSEIKVLVKSGFCDDFAAVSPDGRWIAYHSNVSGRYEIYVERYPELGGRQQLSTNGGVRPLWSRDGRELYFATLDGRQMMAVRVQSAESLVAARPERLFDIVMTPPLGGFRPYDLAPDGRFFVISGGQNESDTRTAPNLVLVQNWTEELKRLVPTK